MNNKDIIIWLVIALIIGGLLSLFASSFPDGLERVAEDKGFIEKSVGKPVLHAPFADYLVPFVKNEQLSGSLAGIAGTLVVFGLGLGTAFLIKPRKSDGRNNNKINQK